MGRREHFDGGAEGIPVSGYVHLPPTPEAIEHIKGMQSAQRMQELDDEIERKGHAVRTAQARNSAYALGGDQRKLKQHLTRVHGAWPEDVQSDAGELARWHKSWHGDSDWDHDHG